MHRRLIAVALAVVVLLGLSDAAHADGTDDAFNDKDENVDATGDAVNRGDEIRATAASESTRGGKAGGDSDGLELCRYRRLDDWGDDLASRMAREGTWSEQPGPGPGAWYVRECNLPRRRGLNLTIVWLPDPAVDPEVLAQEALDRTRIPAPKVHLNPPAGRDQVVNVPTWMWLDPGSWTPVTASASAGAVTVTATATPTSTRWDMGNGDAVVCDGPGTAYDREKPASEQHSDCTYTYGRSSSRQPSGAFTLTVTTTWGVSWTASGAPGGGSLGTASRTTTSAVRVAEIQAVNE